MTSNIIHLSERQAQPSQSGQDGGTTNLSEAEAKCAPPTAKQGRAELAACLTLVAPSGMSAADRNEWLAVAAATLSGIPADLLAEGSRVARERCRFASEIVPTIHDTVKDRWAVRRRNLEWARQAEANRNAPRLESKPDYVRPEQIRELIKSLRMS